MQGRMENPELKLMSRISSSSSGTTYSPTILHTNIIGRREGRGLARLSARRLAQDKDYSEYVKLYAFGISCCVSCSQSIVAVLILPPPPLNSCSLVC